MLLVQDQYEHSYRKNFDSELLLKQETKPFFSEPKEIWGIESNCEEEIITSVNDSEEDDILYAESSNLPEEMRDRMQADARKKNVRFGGSNFNFGLETSETSSVDNEYLGVDRGFLKTETRRILSKEPESVSHKEYFRAPHKLKCRATECGYGRPRSSPEKSATRLGDLEGRPYTIGDYETRRTKVKDHCCGRSHYGEFDFDEYARRKPNHRSCRFQYGDDITNCCDHCPNNEGRRTENKSFAKMKSMPMPTPAHKHKCQSSKGAEHDAKPHRMVRLPQEIHHDAQKRVAGDRYNEYCDVTFGSKNKKKVLEVVQEQLEQFSDSTYKMPCSKYSSQTIPGGLSGYAGKRSSEKLTANSSYSDWLHCGTKEVGRLCVPKLHRMRSRRTRINKIKSGWKKAFVQTVRDGSRNERVGVIVMGSKGPEFYSKNSSPQLSFKKSKILLDRGEQNFEVMAVDRKNVFLSSSEPGPGTTFAVNDLVCPEDDVKVEETIAKFSKNVDDVVKNSEQKFYKSLTSIEYPVKKDGKEDIFKGGGGDGMNQEEDKKVKKQGKTEAQNSAFPSFHLLPFQKLSPRVPKSLRKGETKISEDSKARADALNEAAKQYKETHASLQDREETFLEELKELQEKYPSKDAKPKIREADLGLWDLNLEIEEKEEKKEEENKNDDVKLVEKEKMSKDETSQTGSVKSTEQIILNKQRRKKYYESTTSETKAEVDGDAQNKPPSENRAPKTNKRTSKWESPNVSLEDNKQPEDTDPSVISAVFRDLVENGCAISQEESENLQNTFNRVSYNGDTFSNDVMSSTSSEVTNVRENKANDPQRTPKNPTDPESKEKNRKTCDKGKKKEKQEEGDGYQEDINCKKVLKMRNGSFDERSGKKGEGKNKDGKKKKKIVFEDKMRLLRKALPSIAAQNEAAHLKQLKKYIDRFIDRVEASTSSEFGKRKEVHAKSKESTSTDCSEVRVDARKILDFVSNPFKRISSDVTINIAKKLTDALVQDKSLKGPKNYSETEVEGLVSCGDSSGSGKLVPFPHPSVLTLCACGFLCVCVFLFVVKKNK